MTRYQPFFARLQFKTRQALLAPAHIAALCASEHAVLRNIGEALDGLSADRTTDYEKHWLRRIEQVRERLSGSQEQVDVPDYGAGEPTQSLSAEGMLAGRATREIVGEACTQYSKPKFWASLLFRLIRQFKCESCIELGTCLGISAAYQAAALEVNGKGRLVTLEGAPSFGVIAADTIASLGLRHRAEVKVGRFIDNLPAVLASLGRIDYAFIDGHHDENATFTYFEKLVPYAVHTAVLVFDDIRWSDGMKRAWRRVWEDTRVDIALDLEKVGVCILHAGVKLRRRIIVG